MRHLMRQMGPRQHWDGPGSHALGTLCASDARAGCGTCAPWPPGVRAGPTAPPPFWPLAVLPIWPCRAGSRTPGSRRRTSSALPTTHPSPSTTSTGSTAPSRAAQWHRRDRYDRPRRRARPGPAGAQPAARSARVRREVIQVVGSVPEALARLVADPTPNVDPRTIRHQRHRTPAGRGRPRPPSSGRHRRQGVAARPPRAASAYHSCP